LAAGKRRPAGQTRDFAVNCFQSAFDFDDVVKGFALRTGDILIEGDMLRPQARGTRNSSNYLASVTDRPGQQKIRAAGRSGVIRVPAEFGNPITCFMHAQAYVAETSFGQELGSNDRVRIVCVLTRRHLGRPLIPPKDHRDKACANPNGSRRSF
jgi:hypothetical protein